MKQIILFTFICLLAFPANAEFKVGDKVYTVGTEIFSCDSEKRMRVQLIISIVPSNTITGCEYAEYPKKLTLLGVVTKVKEYRSGSKRRVAIVEVKKGWRRKRWFTTYAIRTTPGSKKEHAVNWFIDNAINRKWDEKPVNLKRWKKNLGNYEVLDVPYSNLHEAYYFPSANLTLVLSLVHYRITNYNSGKDAELN
ncbi:MAG: hypothetical protein HAW65_05995 [Alphaproteobacteria bacterium]|nr:hypothetical protein [Alphaproteobacteria bacterium]